MLIALAVVALFFGLMGFGFGLFAWIEVRAMNKSTHKIQWVPIEPGNPTGMDLAKQIKKHVYDGEEVDDL